MADTRASITRGDLAIFFLGLFLLWFVWEVRVVFVLVAFSLLLAYGLDPVVRRVEMLPGGRVPRRVAAGAVIFTLIVLLALAVGYGAPVLASQVAGFLGRVPEQLTHLSEAVRTRASRGAPWMQQLVPMIDGMSEDTTTLVPQLASWLLRGAAGVLARIQQLLGLLLVPVFTFYLMTDGRELREAFVGFLPARVRDSVLGSRGRVHRALQSYVRGQALVCLIMGTATGSALGVAGMPDVLLLGALAGIAEIVPVLGATLATVVIFLSGLTVDLGRGLVGVGIYVVINWMLGTFVTPRIMGRELKLHPFFVMVSVLAGAQLLGPPGAILALPAAAVLQALVQDVAAEHRAPHSVREH